MSSAVLSPRYCTFLVLNCRNISLPDPITIILLNTSSLVIIVFVHCIFNTLRHIHIYHDMNNNINLFVTDRNKFLILRTGACRPVYSSRSDIHNIVAYAQRQNMRSLDCARCQLLHASFAPSILGVGVNLIGNVNGNYIGRYGQFQRHGHYISEFFLDFRSSFHICVNLKSFTTITKQS